MSEVRLLQKEAGAYYTPDDVVSTLVSWAVRTPSDRMLDPSCGDGRFIAAHRNTVGIERDIHAAQEAIGRAPWALVHEGDFFAWATNTQERFECAAGNPPFIRYQTFKGEARDCALSLCTSLGASFSGLTSSWAPFLVATASLLRAGGRMAFVVPAEIGHSPYASPLVEYLVNNFKIVQIVAVRKKLFPTLSEDCWLLYAEQFGSRTDEIRFSVVDTLRPTKRPPSRFLRVSVREWRSDWHRRLRPYLMSAEARELYQQVVQAPNTTRFGQIATIGIGYVSGANDFFHLRPSDAAKRKIPAGLLRPSVRNGRALPEATLTHATVASWVKNDDPIFLLDIPKSTELPASVRRYLDTAEGKNARETYKCRMRDPWYSVPDVRVPDFFLSYMSGLSPSLVRNDADCTCTNSLHSVRVKAPGALRHLTRVWKSHTVQLSCEIEGHPLGGGMLKLEPREAAAVIVPSSAQLAQMPAPVIAEALQTMRSWRHYSSAE